MNSNVSTVLLLSLLFLYVVYGWRVESTVNPKGLESGDEFGANMSPMIKISSNDTQRCCFTLRF